MNQYCFRNVNNHSEFLAFAEDTNKEPKVRWSTNPEEAIVAPGNLMMLLFSKTKDNEGWELIPEESRGEA